MRVMSYNVLAPRYVTTERYFHCPQWALAKEYRAHSLVKEVEYYQPDIVCFQELTREMKQGYFDPLLGNLGYSATNLVQILSTTRDEVTHLRSSNSDASVEGVGIYFNNTRMELLDTVEVGLDDISVADGRVVSPNSHNVAQVALLRSMIWPQSVILIATVHLYYGKERPEVQIGQLCKIDAVLTQKADEYRASGYTVGVLFAGDLNSEWGSATTQYIASTMARGSLQWSYSAYQQANPTHVTAISPGYRGTIDYIWFDKSVWTHVTNVLATLCSEQAVDPSTGVEGDHVGRILLPTPQYPSDHLPVVCTLSSTTFQF